jgi:hypothetical protein
VRGATGFFVLLPTLSFAVLVAGGVLTFGGGSARGVLTFGGGRARGVLTFGGGGAGGVWTFGGGGVEGGASTGLAGGGVRVPPDWRAPVGSGAGAVCSAGSGCCCTGSG